MLLALPPEYIYTGPFPKKGKFLPQQKTLPLTILTIAPTRTTQIIQQLLRAPSRVIRDDAWLDPIMLLLPFLLSGLLTTSFRTISYMGRQNMRCNNLSKQGLSAGAGGGGVGASGGG